MSALSKALPLPLSRELKSRNNSLLKKRENPVLNTVVKVMNNGFGATLTKKQLANLSRKHTLRR